MVEKKLPRSMPTPWVSRSGTNRYVVLKNSLVLEKNLDLATIEALFQVFYCMCCLEAPDADRAAVRIRALEYY